MLRVYKKVLIQFNTLVSGIWLVVFCHPCGSLHQQIQLYNFCTYQLTNIIIDMQASKNSFGALDEQIDLLIQIIKQQKLKKQKDNPKSRFVIGVCGIPGSGKSTISRKLSQKLQHSVILPMDGFHIVRKLLTEEGIIRRGAAFTFDLDKFQQKILQIRSSQIGTIIKYPDFDHKIKDPVQDTIQVSSDTEILIIEGLYVFDKNLKLNKQQSDKKVWDIRVWINSDLQTCVSRVASRHLESGIEPTYQLALNRASTNDRTNALYVIGNCFDQNKFVRVGVKNNKNTLENMFIIQNGINLNN